MYKRKGTKLSRGEVGTIRSMEGERQPVVNEYGKLKKEGHEVAIHFSRQGSRTFICCKTKEGGKKKA